MTSWLKNFLKFSHIIWLLKWFIVFQPLTLIQIYSQNVYLIICSKSWILLNCLVNILFVYLMQLIYCFSSFKMYEIFLFFNFLLTEKYSLLFLKLIFFKYWFIIIKFRYTLSIFLSCGAHMYFAIVRCTLLLKTLKL